MTVSKDQRRDPLRHLAGALNELEERGLLRVRPDPLDEAPPNLLHLGSNDYLGYRATGRLGWYARAAVEEHPVGSGASRLVLGEHRAHRLLERTIADWVGTEESLVFTSGYAANVGVVGALASEGDLIVSDSLNHASLIDGCRLSRAHVSVVPHNSLDAIRAALRNSTARRRWVITESYFSMEGDSPDLSALRTICDEYDAALVVDEAHAVGALGPRGRGWAAEVGARPDVMMGMLGKALGAQGAFVAGSRDLCRWLWNRARSFVFSTGISPLLAAIAIGSVREATEDDNGRQRLRLLSDSLRAKLRGEGIVVAPSHGPIVPLVLGAEQTALAWSRHLAELGVRIQPIRPPTVPSGTSRLRIALRADLCEADVDRAVRALVQVRADAARD